jgi:hypothetical protein
MVATFSLKLLLVSLFALRIGHVIGMTTNVSQMIPNVSLRRHRQLLLVNFDWLLKCVYTATELRNSILAASTDPTKSPKIIYLCSPEIIFSYRLNIQNGIDMSNRKIDLRCGVSRGCTLNGNGNRIFFGSATQFTATGIEFKNGQAPLHSASGGALLFDDSFVALNQCSFRNNKADLWGGAIAMHASSLLLNGSSSSSNVMTFMNNHAWSGGSIYLDEFSDLTINTVTFFNNTALHRVYEYEDEPILQAGRGGSLSLRYSNATMTNVAFVGNQADAVSIIMANIILSTWTSNSYIIAIFKREVQFTPYFPTMSKYWIPLSQIIRQIM